jgi:hypothetical protein
MKGDQSLACKDSRTVGDPLPRDRDIHNEHDQTRRTWETAVSLLMHDHDGHWPLTTRARVRLEPIWVTTPEEVYLHRAVGRYLEEQNRGNGDGYLTRSISKARNPDIGTFP